MRRLLICRSQLKFILKRVLSIGSSRCHPTISIRGDRDSNNNQQTRYMYKPLTFSMQIDMTLLVHARIAFPRLCARHTLAIRERERRIQPDARLHLPQYATGYVRV